MSARPFCALALAALALGACELFGTAAVPGGDPAVDYESCEDAEGRVAWQEAQQALATGDDRTALARLLDATRRCPDLVRAHIAYQDLARRLGGDDERRMIDAYTADTIGRDTGSPVPAYLRARLAETAYTQAGAIEKILATHPDFAWAHLSRGRINRGQGRLNEALRDFERAIRRDGGLLEARLDRAQVLVELGRDEEAAVEFDSYLKSRPGDQRAMQQYMTLLLYRLGRVREAIARIDMLEALGDDSIALRMDRAAAMWRANLHQAAVEIYLGILAEAPDTARAALNIGLLYYEIVPKDDAARRRYWPKARAAFRMFLASTEPSDGHEQFERTWAVPARLDRIEQLLGPADDTTPTLAMLRWPDA